MAWTICTDSFKFADGTVGTPVPFPTSYMSAGVLQRVDFVSGGSSPFVVEKPITGEWIIGPDSEGSYFSINVTGYGDGSWGHVTIEGVITFWHEPSRRSMSTSLGFNGEDGLKLGIGLYYDEDNKKAGFIKFEGDSRGYVGTTTSDPGYPNTAKYFYNFLKNNIYVSGASVIVNYYLPDYDYTYAKITYKQDSEPDSETDGESVEILKDETSVNIEGLEEDKTYYFKIFTDKSESEAFPYTVGSITDPVPPEYKEKCIKIGSTQIGNESTREFYNSEYKLYSGTAIYDTIYNYSRKATYISRSNTVHFDSDRSQYATRFWIADDIVTISFDTTTNIATYSSINVNKNFYTSNNVNFAWFYCAYSNTSNCYTGSFTQAQTSGYNTKPSFGPSSFTTFFENGIGEFIDYIYKRFRNVNLYVDGVQWVTGSLS